jgi:hypothetical protein
MREPSWWQFVLLALGAYRIYRLAARDTLTEPVRAALTYPDAQAVTLDTAPDDEGLTIVGDYKDAKPLRVYASTLIRCHWCLGFYVSVAAWGLWDLWPRPMLFAMTPWALSATVALISKNLDA